MNIRKDQFKLFKELHDQASTFILPNAWDVNSAKLFEAAGFKALGTTSAGISAALGYTDGEQIPFADVLGIASRMIKSLSIPVTVDIEQGYAQDDKTLLQNMNGLIEIGAVGINIEDGFHYLDSESEHVFSMVDRIKTIKQHSNRIGEPMFINARVDTYWLKVLSEENRFIHTIEKANSYLAAGADCIFIPSVDDPKLMEQLISRINGPINFLLGKNTPSQEALTQIGVARLSTGSAPFRKITAVLQGISSELRDGKYESLLQDTLPYSEMFDHLK
ncbi:isocitrate lyase/phosphoenolpyruvate mutase family protein [Paenibacillus rhizovicinus]|uniref:Isocitrate lyase/phosphoenolpyruvate mutase family protein n=1 Tax=Paenibacillus rhizovicinus TaxID=2704463 RepID=A0A6C0NTF6_9BACL|nr:isocitrate lyase/phosphoenolpyruvate mutase family protein [Paenibacillus rhizovicinus]QHW29447.1 isocitrate lyase/phosphoenolpyruvate mutase family protein [Paenibacillus rhizovicinus]